MNMKPSYTLTMNLVHFIVVWHVTTFRLMLGEMSIGSSRLYYYFHVTSEMQSSVTRHVQIMTLH